MGAALFAEYEDVLARPALFKRCRLSGLRDEADNQLIELALAGGATHIVTRNVRRVANMELRFPHLPVISPEQFLKEKAP